MSLYDYFPAVATRALLPAFLAVICVVRLHAVFLLSGSARALARSGPRLQKALPATARRSPEGSFASAHRSRWKMSAADPFPGQDSFSRSNRRFRCALHPPGMRPFITITSNEPLTQSLLHVLDAHGGRDFGSRANQHVSFKFQHRFFVFDQQHAPSSAPTHAALAQPPLAAPAFSLASKRTSIVAPPSSRLRATISPPCSLTIP